MSPLGKQITAIHILPNISRNKCNLTMKIGLLVEYKMRIIFLKKSVTLAPWCSGYQVQILLMMHQRFAMRRISGNGPGWK